MSKQTTLIIGQSLTHTLSPVLHNYVYKKLGIDAEMLTLDTADLAGAVKEIKERPIALTAVTIPHKRAIIGYLDEVDTEAQKIGAVNTVINKNGKLFGYNTDIVGIKKSLEAVELKNKTVLLLGAGGVAQPVAYLVNSQGGELLCNCRTQAEGKSLVTKFGGRVVDLADLKAKEIDLIINTTPVGMYPNSDTMPIEPTLLSNHQVVFDLVYNPLKTKLLQTAAKHGATTISGLTMFVCQGLEQIRLWSGQEYSGTELPEMLIQEINK